MEGVLQETERKEILTAFFQKNEPLVDLQLALSVAKMVSTEETPDYSLLSAVLQRHPNDTLIMEATISSLMGREKAFRDFLLDEKIHEENDAIIPFLDKAIHKAATTPLVALEPSFGTRTDRRTQGMQLFRTNCATCHGMGGLGIENLAPPLAGSDYVEGSEDRLILVALHGLSGPIHINGERYELNAVMPGIKENPNLSDDDIASILTFVKNAFAKESVGIKPKRVAELRAETPEGYSFTEEELAAKVKALKNRK
jgi:mono/diheme cytochrome c family protein